MNTIPCIQSAPSPALALPIPTRAPSDNGALQRKPTPRLHTAKHVQPPADASFRTLFDQFFEQLLKRAERIIDCPHRAQEVVLDVFTKYWHRRGEFDVHTSVEGYLKSAVSNRAIDYLRSARRRRVLSGQLPAQRPCPAARPDELAHAGHLSDRIDRAIEALPPRGREIFCLNRYEGLTYHQIAEHCGVSYKTVETHMRRSLIALRNRLQPFVDREL